MNAGAATADIDEAEDPAIFVVKRFCMLRVCFGCSCSLITGCNFLTGKLASC